MITQQKKKLRVGRRVGTEMLNDTGLENLDNYIDSLQADTGLRSRLRWRVAHNVGQQGDVEATMLQMAAHLNSMRPGANKADEGFISRLRERVLAEAVSSHQPS